MLKNKRFIIWDWNGTLLNDAQYAYSALRTMQIERGISPITFEQYQSFYEHPIEKLYQRAGFDFAREPFAVIAEKWHEIYNARLAEIGLHHDTGEVLNNFRQKGLKQSVLSALPHDLLIESIESRNLTNYFDLISGATDNLGNGKIEHGVELIKQLKIEKEAALLIGDSSHDYEVASALEIDCVLVARGLEDRKRLMRHGVEVLDDFSKLII
jgi:phosphoglycolate phosphatase